jgi:hypothetical protein
VQHQVAYCARFIPFEESEVKRITLGRLSAMHVIRPRKIIEVAGRTGDNKPRRKRARQPSVGVLLRMSGAIPTTKEPAIEIEVGMSRQQLAARTDEVARKQERRDSAHAAIGLNPWAVQASNAEHRSEARFIY